MNRILRYVLIVLLLCPSAFARRHTAHEPVFFDTQEPETVQTPPAPDYDAPAASEEEEAPEEELEEQQEEIPEDSGEIPPPPSPDKRTTAERTGAVFYAPAMDGEYPDEPLDGGRRVRLELGVRCLGVWLTDDRQGKPFDGSFIGSIYKLKAKQNWAPINPYLQVKTEVGGGAWLGVGATYSHLETETLDDGGGDGDIVTDAALAYVLLERPFVNGHIRPFVQVGGGIAFNDFDAIGSWGAGGMRSFELDDAPAFLVAGGCAFALAYGFSVDAYVRYLRCEMDGTYVYRGDARPDTDFTFPISHIAAGVGVSYVF